MDALIFLLTFEGNVFVPSADRTTIWPHKNECMHPPCKNILNLFEPIHSHFRSHLELEAEPFEVQDLVQLLKVLHLGQPPHIKQDDGIVLKQHI